jgi:hypothetical protein
MRPRTGFGNGQADPEQDETAVKEKQPPMLAATRAFVLDR